MTSFNAADVASYRIVGTKGQLHVDPAYEYAEGLGYELTVDGKTHAQDASASAISSRRSCCTSRTASCRIATPEPSGEEGLQDVRIVQALYESAETGKAVAIPPFREVAPAERAPAHQRPGIRKPALVKVQSASVD